MSVGIAGLISARLTETYNRPSIALCDEGEYLKGSGRSVESVNLKEMLDSINNLLLGYGGHAAACGVKIAPENLEEVRSKLNAATGVPGEKCLEYDIEIDATSEALEEVISSCENYAPFGESNPEIIVKLTNVELGDKYGNISRVMGSDNQHVKLLAEDFSILWFNHAKDYEDMGYPETVSVIGSVSENIFNGKRSLQIIAQDIKVE